MIKNLSEALGVVKEMDIDGEEWSGDYRQAARDALATFLRYRMEAMVAARLSWAFSRGVPDRRNGSYLRHVLTELGDVMLSIPRTRHYSPRTLLAAYARRAKQVNHLILACFLLGLSTRKVGTALLSILGEVVSPQTVSRVARTLDGAVRAFHRRTVRDRYHVLILDGIVVKRRTGAGSLRRTVLVALGIRDDGKKEIIDFWNGRTESAEEWQSFLTDLHRRGLTGEHLKVVCADGGAGLIAALPFVYPHIPLQRCWAHKMRNILDKVRRKDQKKVKKGLSAVYQASGMAEARGRATTWMQRWKDEYPNAVRCLKEDLEDLLTCFRFDDPDFRKTIRTTNAIERRFREVRRRTRPMGVFSDRTSVERILYAVFMHENMGEGVYPVFGLTQNT